MMVADLESKSTITNWASLIRHLLLSMGFKEVWLQQGVCNYKNFNALCKQRLSDNFIQNWHSRIEESSRAFFIGLLLHFSFNHILIKSTFLNIYTHLVSYACPHTD